MRGTAVLGSGGALHVNLTGSTPAALVSLQLRDGTRVEGVVGVSGLRVQGHIGAPHGGMMLMTTSAPHLHLHLHGAAMPMGKQASPGPGPGRRMRRTLLRGAYDVEVEGGAEPAAQQQLHVARTGGGAEGVHAVASGDGSASSSSVPLLMLHATQADPRTGQLGGTFAMVLGQGAHAGAEACDLRITGVWYSQLSL